MASDCETSGGETTIGKRLGGETTRGGNGLWAKRPKIPRLLSRLCLERFSDK